MRRSILEGYNYSRRNRYGRRLHESKGRYKYRVTILRWEERGPAEYTKKTIKFSADSDYEALLKYVIKWYENGGDDYLPEELRQLYPTVQSLLNLPYGEVWVSDTYTVEEFKNLTTGKVLISDIRDTTEYDDDEEWD